MPTITKLIAAVYFAAIAYLSAIAFREGMPANTHFGQFDSICAGVGALCGWLVMGSATGNGYRNSAGAGLRTSVTIVAWVLLICSIILMLRKAFMKRYISPTDAVVDVFALALENAAMVLQPKVLGLLIVGGLLGGLLAEFTKTRWE